MLILYSIHKFLLSAFLDIDNKESIISSLEVGARKYAFQRKLQNRTLLSCVFGHSGYIANEKGNEFSIFTEEGVQINILS